MPMEQPFLANVIKDSQMLMEHVSVLLVNQFLLLVYVSLVLKVVYNVQVLHVNNAYKIVKLTSP